MIEMSVEEKKNLQLNILDAVDEFCGEHGIRYSIACGTLLGAVRHGGYIPWDDDIDIYMPRNDYLMFEKIFPKKYKEKYQLYCSSRDKQWHLPFAKIADNKTLIVNQNAKIIPLGVNIDVFPIDDVPCDVEQWRRFHKKQIKLIRLNLLRICEFNKIKGIRNKLIILYAKVYCGLYYPSILNHIDKFIQMNNNQGYDCCFECVQGLHVKSPFKKELFDSLIEWEFEDRKYKGFKFADDYLRNTYGDYMKLPPKEQQISHHADVAFWIDK